MEESVIIHKKAYENVILYVIGWFTLDSYGRIYTKKLFDSENDPNEYHFQIRTLQSNCKYNCK